MSKALMKLEEMRDELAHRQASLRMTYGDPMAQVMQFHRVMKMPIIEPSLDQWAADHLDMPLDRLKLRFELVREEFEELREALGLDSTGQPDLSLANFKPSISQVADALGDMIYVIFGFALEAGIPLPEVIDEIHAANLTKLDDNGQPVYRADGKVTKSSNYTPPEIRDAVMRMLRYGLSGGDSIGAARIMTKEEMMTGVAGMGTLRHDR